MVLHKGTTHLGMQALNNVEYITIFVCISTKMNFLSLILTLPTENATIRQRIWRALKASGAAVLRDGVYLLPERPQCRTTLEYLAQEVMAHGGSALVLRTEEPAGTEFSRLFDRSPDYQLLQEDIGRSRGGLTPENASEVLKQARKLRKAYVAIVEVDFFPNETQQQTAAALAELEQACALRLTLDEPAAAEGKLDSLAITDYQGRLWATRRRPWVDRLASAWLIRRFIDPEARFLWLAQPGDCPAEALGFDFDGAPFTHIGHRVSFEVLAHRFGLEHEPALVRLGNLVHALDVGGAMPPEAAGVEAVLAGMRSAHPNDDGLIVETGRVFDGLYENFVSGKKE